LNDTDSAWLSLATEGDPHVLGKLLWDWLDQLKVSLSFAFIFFIQHF